MRNNGTFTILGLAGSLRQRSYNRALLHAAQEMVPPHVQMRIFELAGLPLFNEDIEAAGDPPAVQALKDSIASADALLIATPEYNYSAPAVLTNALDWASRAPNHEPSVLVHKPVALMGATLGEYGTVRAQLVLRQVLASVECCVLLKPEVFIARASEHFDSAGKLQNRQTRQAVKQLLYELLTWAKQGGSSFYYA